MVMPPAVSYFSKCFCTTAGVVLKSSVVGKQHACLCRCCVPLVQVWWVCKQCYTTCMRNLMRRSSAFYSSFHVTYLSTIFFHLVQVPCYFIPTALRILIFSAAALTSSWTKRRTSFLRVFIWGNRKSTSSNPSRGTTPTGIFWCCLDSIARTASSALASHPMNALLFCYSSLLFSLTSNNSTTFFLLRVLVDTTLVVTM